METPPPIPGAKVAAIEEFLRDVLRSGLIERDKLQTALRGVPPEQRADVRAVAEFLVRGGLLSRFQARRLLKGRWRGLILGPYQVLAPIGRGGMSTVFLARDSRSSALLALKVLPHTRAERRQRARFRREMQMSRRVSHPHVATTYSSGKIDGVYYIAMEFIPGKSLQRLVQSDGPLDVPRAARLMTEVAMGLEHAHEKGLIHRDLKPSNIMVTPHDHAKVLDLGLALIEGEDVADVRVVGGKGYIVGTMDYIAPEQTNNSAAVDRRADIYSLGCTLYYAVTGRPPFPGGSSREKIERQRREEPESLLELKPTLPVEFVVLIRRMMAKDPSQRPVSAADVIRRLRPWADNSALPLDRTDDPEYSTAVLALQGELAPFGGPSDLETSRSDEQELPEWSTDDAAFTIRMRQMIGTRRLRAIQITLYAVLGVFIALALMSLGAIVVLVLTRR